MTWRSVITRTMTDLGGVRVSTSARRADPVAQHGADAGPELGDATARAGMYKGTLG